MAWSCCNWRDEIEVVGLRLWEGVERRRWRPKSAMMGSMSEDKRMLVGLRLPCTCFLSWRKAKPRAIPLAIFTRASKVKFMGDDPVLPE